jgi:putative AlgH/UPF0301 family transcriptional regulator
MRLRSIGSCLNGDCITIRRRKRCDNLSAWCILASSILSLLSLISSSLPLVRSFGVSNGFGSRPRRILHQNQNQNQNHCNPRRPNISNPKQEGFRATVARTYSVVASSSSSYLRELETVDEIREGSLVLSRVETSLGCHDLRQPYFHKAVVLVLDHDPEDFTQGVLLNRASDLTLDDRDIVYVEEETDDDYYYDDVLFEGIPAESQQNDAVSFSPSSSSSSESSPPTTIPSSSSTSWRIHFGGDIGGWYEEVPQLLCIHGISSAAALAVSDPIFGSADCGVYITSHMGARSLVESGEATSDMFYTFSGFCGWEKDMLQLEVDRGSWCLASFVVEENDEAVDPLVAQKQNQQHILMDLIKQYSWKNPDYKPQSGGLEFWHKIMADLGKDNVEPVLPKNPQPFSDLMMKEWATQRLLMTNNGSSSGDDTDNDNSSDKGENTSGDEPPTSQIDDADIFRALKAASGSTPVSAGAILRGSSAPSFPYLLNGQLFHKSTILLLQDTPKEASVGVLLNLPTKDAYILRVGSKDYRFPIRYGGPSGKEDDGEEDPHYFWFHDSKTLKAEGIGVHISFSNDHPERTNDPSCIYVCELEDVHEAIVQGLARENDFFLVRGFCAWEKEDNGSAGGVTGEILNGNLEDTTQLWKTPKERERLWTSLREQKQTLSEDCLNHNLALSRLAWEQGGDDKAVKDDNLDDGIRRVFDSTVDVSKLADDALFVWMKIFLLGNGVYYPEDS